MKKINLIVLTGAQLLVFPVLVLAHDDQYGMWPGMMGWGHSMGWPMMLFMFLFWGVVLAGFILLIRSFFSRSGHDVREHHESALDILKKRYARGEIDQAEFEEKKRVLED